MENINEIASELWKIKQEITLINESLKELNKKKQEFEYRLASVLETNNMDQVRTDDATFTLKKSIKPKAEDWQQIYQWVKENDGFSLLYKQLSPAVYREYLELGETIPGTSSYEHTTINTLKRK